MKFTMLALLIFMFSCDFQDATADPLMGTWIYADSSGAQILIISEKYEIVSTGEVFGARLKGTWTADGERIRVSTAKGDVVLTYHFDGLDVLWLTDERGETMETTRIYM